MFRLLENFDRLRYLRGFEVSLPLNRGWNIRIPQRSCQALALSGRNLPSESENLYYGRANPTEKEAVRLMLHEAPHTNRTTTTATIINALKRRAQAVLNDTSIDPQSRAIIRYAMKINDPWLAELVRRADAGESLFDTVDSRTQRHEPT